MSQTEPYTPKRDLGIIIQSTGRRCKVQTEDKCIYECAVRGKFRIQGIKATNPVAVGDQVKIQVPKPPEELGLILEVFPRKNYISRKAIAQSHKEHILCANIDQALLIFTLDQPVTSYGFADRFLLVTTVFDIPTKIILNKVDLVTTPELQKKQEEVIQAYKSIGFEVIPMCSTDPSYKATATSLLQDAISFLGGHSGVGKSTLINLVEGKLKLKTTEISEYSNKGKHTTTFAEMHPLSVGGYIIDSPGIKELGIANFEKEDVSHNFPEFFERLSDCKFHNCLHVNEPGCAVKKAIESGEIPESRYQSYLSILEDIDDANKL